MLDELSREEKSGFKAEIANGSEQKSASAMSKTDEKQAAENMNKFNNGKDASKKEVTKKKSSPEAEEYYGDEFEDIDEDLPPNDDDLEASGEGIRPSKIGESHGITVS